jgi:hypothetical protein
MAVDSSLEVWGYDIRQLVERVGSRFTEPDDDWLPHLMIEHPGGMSVFQLSLVLFNGVEAKNRLAEWMAEAIASSEARRFALVMSTWQVRGVSEAEIQRYGRVANHPARFEAVVLHVCDREREIWSIAEIKRSKTRPPRLGPWSDFTTMEGRFDVLREALRS